MQEMLENSFFQSLYDMHYYSLLSRQFGYGISSMVGLIKQDFWPNINIIKENYWILWYLDDEQWQFVKKIIGLTFSR